VAGGKEVGENPIIKTADVADNVFARFEGQFVIDDPGGVTTATFHLFVDARPATDVCTLAGTAHSG
jgi:hypothetical protein